jgi:hypothetical protein
MPAVPAHGIDAGLRRHNRERGHDHRPGARPAGAGSAKTLRAYRWQNTFSVVRRILRNERGHGSIEDLFRGSLPVFSGEKFQRHRSRSCSGRGPQLLIVDGQRDPNLAATSNHSCGTAGYYAIHLLQKVGGSNWPKIPSRTRGASLRSDSIAASFWRIALAQNSAWPRTDWTRVQTDRAPSCCSGALRAAVASSEFGVGRWTLDVGRFAHVFDDPNSPRDSRV